MGSIGHIVSCARGFARALSTSALVGLAALAAMPAWANSFTVTTGSDGSQQAGNTASCAEVDNANVPTGKCSLRAAIMLGNNITGPHTITFSPAVTKVTVVNGGLAQLRAQFSVIGALPARTAIDGNGHGCLDLTDSGTEQNAPVAIHNGKGATGSTISNLVIGNCSGAGISANGHGYTFTNNYIGVDSTGNLAWQNNGNGIWLSASVAYDDQFINTSALNSLNNALPVQPVSAVDISNFSTSLASILVNLQPNTIKDNVLSGNALNGIELFSKSLAATLISNNLIGTNATGTLAIANGNNGVHLVGSTFGNLIGPNNVISGNAQNGIEDDAGAVFLPNFVMGNRIGLANLNGAHAGNGQGGIVVDSTPSTDPAYFNPSLTSLVIGPLNVIADNQGTNNALNLDDANDTQAGVMITGTSTGVKVLGNVIGIAEFPAGTPLASKLYGNLGDGIIVTTSGNQIGAAGLGNTIAGNARHGIVVRGNATTGNSLVGNAIGVHAGFAGNLALGNGGDGVRIDNASASVIGGTGASDFNTIAANGRNGVKIVNGGTSNGWGNVLQRNRIYHNAVALAGVGIDLDRAQNASNPLISGPAEYPTNYANLDQAQPVLCAGPGDTGACAGSSAPVSNGGSANVQWTITTHGPNAHLRMEFFALDTADANTATQLTWVAEQVVDTDASGQPTGVNCASARCSMQIPGAFGGKFLTLTATDITALTNVPGAPGDWKAGLKCFIGKFGDPTGIISACPANNTSEFSNVVGVPAPAPSATTNAASTITTSSATLNGNINDNGAATMISFEYGADTNYGTLVTAIPASLAAGAGSTPVTGPVSGLVCATTYHFRIKASNSGGITFGNDATFSTLACPAQAPSATTLAASNITTTSVTFNGSVSANGGDTQVFFDYGASNAYGNVIGGTPGTVLANVVNGAVSATVVAACSTTVHFRVRATNLVATTNGGDLTATVGACGATPPTLSASAVSNLTANSVTLIGSGNANGFATSLTWEYGTSASYGQTAVAVPNTITGTSSTAITANLSGLNCATTYHYRLDGSSIGGSVVTADHTFMTAACAPQAPSATTNAATAVTATSATLNGTVSANGTATSVSFDYGVTMAYGSNMTAAQSPLAANASNALVSATVSALNCGQTYHFRVNAQNGSSGTGADQTFTTAACPVTTFTGPTATGTGNATAVLSGGGASCTLVNPAFIAAPVSPPAGMTFPDGLFQFQASGCTGSITLTVTFPTAFAANVQYWKYGPTQNQNSNHWYTLGAANNLSLSAHVATFTIADGGLGDDDLTVNGTIIDAGGPSVGSAITQQAAVPAPTLDTRSLIALIALLSVLGAGVLHCRGSSLR